MALNIKNAEVERLAAQVAGLAGENKTEAVRRALAERKERLAMRHVATDRQARLQAFLDEEVWPLIPPAQRGRRLSAEEEEAILGYGEGGV